VENPSNLSASSKDTSQQHLGSKGSGASRIVNFLMQLSM